MGGCPFCQANPSLTPSPGIKALGLPPRPPGQLRWVPPQPHRASFKKKPFFFFLYALETTLRDCSVPGARAPTTYPPGTEALAPPPEPLPRLPDPPSTKPGPCLPSQPFPDPFPWNQGPWSTPRSTRPAPVGTPPTPQGILQKKPFFFFLYADNKNTTHVAKFAPSLGPVSLPPTPPEPKPLHPPPSPCPASLTPRPPSQLRGWFQPLPASQPFPDPFLWNQGPWPTPPSTRPAPVGTPPHPTGHPSKKAIFLLNNKNTTHVAKFAPSLGPVPLPPTPPEPKPLHPPRALAPPP